MPIVAEYYLHVVKKCEKADFSWHVRVCGCMCVYVCAYVCTVVVLWS